MSNPPHKDAKQPSLKIRRIPGLGDEFERKVSDIHWALSGGYEVGGVLEKGDTPKEVLEERNDLIPCYTDEMMLIKIRSPSPATIMKL